jgi:hypothetical protein
MQGSQSSRPAMLISYSGQDHEAHESLVYYAYFLTWFGGNEVEIGNTGFKINLTLPEIVGPRVIGPMMQAL